MRNLRQFRVSRGGKPDWKKIATKSGTKIANPDLPSSSDTMAARDEAAKTSTLLVQLGWSFPKLGVAIVLGHFFVVVLYHWQMHN